MVHANYCAPYPKPPCVRHEVNMWYTCCIISLFLEPSMSFFLCHITNPNPKFYKYKNKSKRKEKKIRNEKKLSNTVYYNIYKTSPSFIMGILLSNLVFYSRVLLFYFCQCFTTETSAQGNTLKLWASLIYLMYI